MTDQATNPTNNPEQGTSLTNFRFFEYRDANLAEHTAVAKILRWAGVKKSTISSFAELEEMGFPVHLTISSERRQLGTLLKDLMTRPRNSLCYTLHQEARAAMPGGESLGVILPWRSSFWVFHDCDLGTVHGDAGFYVTIDDFTYFFENLSSLVSKLGPSTDW